MRLKHILNRLQAGERLKIVYERITLTGFTKTFVLIALAHCFVQIALQATALSFNRQAGDRVNRILDASQIPRQYAFVSNGKLYVCSGVPPSGDPFDTVCWAFAGPGVAIMNTTQMGGDDDDDKENRPEPRFAEELAVSGLGRRDFSAIPVFDDGEVSGVNVTGLNSEDSDQVTQLSTRCINALNWPSIVLRDAQREDIGFLFYQVWLLGISVVTILNESIPHLVAALITHSMSTVWSAYQVSRTERYHQEYQSLVVNDTCDGVDIIPNFWVNRMKYLIPIMVLNAVALLAISAVSARLFRIYARQTFKRVGASKKLNLLYSYVLLFSVFLQLSAFFTIAGSALWIDALSSGVLRGSTAYRVIFIVVSVVKLPWVIIGWLSIRRECRFWSLVFLIVGLALCGAWTTMFANVVYRWEFQNFPFFATLTITAFISLVGTVVLAVVCRINFGKGLPNYLKTEETFDDSSFIPVIVPSKRRSKNVSVIFPDKRTSAFRKGSSLDEKLPLSSDKVNDRRVQRSSSVTSVIDIKAPSGRPSIAGSDVMTSHSIAADDGHGSRRNSRSPFFRLSDNSRFGLGKMSLRFSAFTSNSRSSDLEHGVPDVPEVPALPKVPPTSYQPQTRPSETSPSEPARRSSGLSRNFSTSSRSVDLPAINVIPASARLSNAIAVQGDLSVQAASETSSFSSDSWGSSYVSRSRNGPSLARSVSSGSARPISSGSSTRPGLPKNPRAFRS